MFENCVLQRNGFNGTVLWSPGLRQSSRCMDSLGGGRCCCQFITKLMVTLMTATNDTNRPGIDPTHPRKSLLARSSPRTIKPPKRLSGYFFWVGLVVSFYVWWPNCQSWLTITQLLVALFMLPPPALP